MLMNISSVSHQVSNIFTALFHEIHVYIMPQITNVTQPNY
jgi:hypothetical protein